MVQVRRDVIECLHHGIRITSDHGRTEEKKKLSPAIHSTAGNGGCPNRYESEQEEKIMASSAQPTRLSKLSFPRYTTSLATMPRIHQSLALHILHAAQGTHVSDHQRPPARIISSQTRRTLAALPLATTSPLIFSPACTSITAHRVRSPLRSGPHVVFELPV